MGNETFDEVRTRRLVVVGPDGFERITLTAEEGSGEVRVMARPDPGAVLKDPAAEVTIYAGEETVPSEASVRVYRDTEVVGALTSDTVSDDEAAEAFVTMRAMRARCREDDHRSEGAGFGGRWVRCTPDPAFGVDSLTPGTWVASAVDDALHAAEVVERCLKVSSAIEELAWAAHNDDRLSEAACDRWRTSDVRMILLTIAHWVEQSTGSIVSDGAALDTAELRERYG